MRQLMEQTGYATHFADLRKVGALGDAIQNLVKVKEFLTLPTEMGIDQQ
jgi:hypothetical protein